jgi:hypothetical protein
MDKNGRITTVHRKEVSGAGVRRMPPPAGLLSDPFGFGRRKERAWLIEDNLASLTSLKINGVDLFSARKLEEAEGTIRAVKDLGFHSALERVIHTLKEPSDLEFLREALTGIDSIGCVRTIRLLDEYSGVLQEHPGNAEKLYRLDGITSHYFGDPEKPDSIVPTIESHFKAKIAYPHGMQTGHEIQYEMATPYFHAVQSRPDLLPELIEYVRHCKQEDIDDYTIGVLTGVADHMPEQMDRFMEVVKERGVGKLLSFMDERDVEDFDAEIMRAYLETHNAINDGWL